MNILEVRLGSKTGTVHLLSLQKLIWEKEFHYSNYEEAISTLIKIVRENNLSFEGGTTLFEEKGFPFDQGCFPTEQGGYEGIIKTLTEAFNQPFLLNIPSSSPVFLEKLQKASEKETWTLNYYDLHPGKEEYCVESLLTVGNGYMGLRGTLPEMKISNDFYPATYLAGLYNRAESVVDGQIVSNEDFVNAPNLQYISFSIGDEPVCNLNSESIQFIHRKLDMKTGLFSSVLVYEDEQGRQVEIQTERFVSLQNRHEYRIKYQVTPLNFSEKITIVSKADGDIQNYNVERYRKLTSNHLAVDKIEVGSKNALLVAHTLQSDQTIVQKSSFKIDDTLLDTLISYEKSELVATQYATFNAKLGTCYNFEKTVEVQVFTAENKSQMEAFIEALISPKLFDEMREEEIPCWDALWKESEISIKGDLLSQKFLHLHAFHLMVSASFPGNKGVDASVTARGLHGEGYRGHIFWDELFIFPFYIFHFPETARQLLQYRFNRLEAAKQNAQEEGYTGAMYPWQSGVSGEEETQKLHLNPLTGTWGEDHSRLQRHVSIAIAYDIWKYYKVTGDASILKEKGAETYLEILRFWENIAEYNPEDGRYHIDGVMGPDEFHEAFPGNSEPGLKDNAYSNLMVVWMIEELPTILNVLSTKEKENLLRKTGFTSDVLEKLDKIKKQLALEISPEGIIAQFDGFFKLKQVDWDFYREKYGNIYRMDRILLAEGESADDYQVSKQADLFMAFYVLSKERITKILNHLGYVLPEDFEKKNYDYYLERTSHGSTLSRVVYSATGWEIGERSNAWSMYKQALASDYNDIQGGTTAEGIHTGVMSATLSMVLDRFAGLNLDGLIPIFSPNLPEQWSEIAFSFYSQGVRYQVKLIEDSLSIQSSEDTEIEVNHKKYFLEKTKEKVILLKGNGYE